MNCVLETWSQAFICEIIEESHQNCGACDPAPPQWHGRLSPDGCNGVKGEVKIYIVELLPCVVHMQCLCAVLAIARLVLTLHSPVAELMTFSKEAPTYHEEPESVGGQGLSASTGVREPSGHFNVFGLKLLAMSVVSARRCGRSQVNMREDAGHRWLFYEVPQPTALH